MLAVIQTGGKQVRVQVGDVVQVERLPGEVGTPVSFDRVLLVTGADGDAQARVGNPTVSGAKVTGRIVRQGRAKKILVKTYKRRQNSNRKSRGHRQAFTAVEIDAIEA